MLHVILPCTILIATTTRHTHQQSHFLSDLLIRLLGFLAVLDEVFLRFMPSMRAQKDLLRAAAFFEEAAFLRETGALRFPPVALLYEARPLAFKPPFGFLPAFRCHAGDLATSTAYYPAGS